LASPLAEPAVERLAPLLSTAGIGASFDGIRVGVTVAVPPGMVEVGVSGPRGDAAGAVGGVAVPCAAAQAGSRTVSSASNDLRMIERLPVGGMVILNSRIARRFLEKCGATLLDKKMSEKGYCSATNPSDAC